MSAEQKDSKPIGDHSECPLCSDCSRCGVVESVRRSAACRQISATQLQWALAFSADLEKGVFACRECGVTAQLSISRSECADCVTRAYGQCHCTAQFRVRCRKCDVKLSKSYSMFGPSTDQFLKFVHDAADGTGLDVDVDSSEDSAP